MISALYKACLLLLLLPALPEKDRSVCGTYQIVNAEWGGHRLVLKTNKHFIETTSGCVYDDQTTGRWEIAGDTLILHPSGQKNLRSGRNSELVPDASRSLIRGDTLYAIAEDGVARIGPEYALVRGKQ